MKKKIIYAVLIFIIVLGIVIIATKGLKADIVYSQNERIDVYLGKEYNKEEVENLAKEVFGVNRVLLNQVEYYGDMFSLIVPANIPEFNNKVEEFNKKINEKYELKNEIGNEVEVKHQSNIRLSSLLKQYISPICISLVIIVIYASIRFRKIGSMRALANYILVILTSECLYLSFLAIFRFNINRIVIPIGLLIYILGICIVTTIEENKLEMHRESLKENKSKEK